MIIMKIRNKLGVDYYLSFPRPYNLFGIDYKFTRFDGKQNTYEGTQYYGYVMALKNACNFNTLSELKKINISIIISMDII